MKEELLGAENIRMSYRRDRVLDIGRIAVSDGEIVTLSGPNGAGKTTCLRILAGLAKPERGAKFFVRGLATRCPVPGRDCGFLHQRPHMLDTTVRGNIEYALRRNVKTRLQSPIEMLSLAGLENLADRHAHKLSGGQRQLLAIARLHAAGAPLLLLDEPSSNLDSEGCAALARMLELLAPARRAALVSTHDERIAKLFPGARALHLEHGRLVGKNGRESGV